ncbi:MAG TPA: uroporphyrinogen-III C-methyltransferase [Gammaproteobacteria bacterium]|nr:uroporphyrinogen-III C-methyltransferase [Gammaproteobacteria bacterium]
MNLLPLFHKLKRRRCLVVGGGEVAARKVGLLLQAGAQVTVVAPALVHNLQERLDEQGITHIRRAFADQDLANVHLVVAATNDRQTNRRVFELAETQGIPVNVVDQPDLCTFFFPSIIDRSPVVAAVSSGGTAPVLARHLRARLETLIPASYGRLAGVAAGFREQVKTRLKSTAGRRRFWEQALTGHIAELAFSGRTDAAKRALQQALDDAAEESLRRGEVYLVGAGPGDPDLLTFRALRLMQQCDVVLYDRLVSPAIVDLCRREAERVYVGKKRSFHTLRQEEINAELVALAKAGKRVLRLKGGDPFIFGRGGEEIETLAAEGVAFQIVPGITAASGCAAYAGIPLTHRDYAQSVLFVTGHLKDGSMDLNWPALVQPAQTLVVYMGLTGLATLCTELMNHGMRQDTLAALVEQGTTPEQRVLIGTLASLPGIVAKTDVRAPTLVIVGEVVRLHDKLAWF